MKPRVLPPDEWSRVKGLDIAELLPHLREGSARLIVVEDDAGEIVGAWCMIQVTHLEGFWVSPEHSKRAGVVRALLRTAMGIAAEDGDKWVTTGSDSPAIDAYIRRLGGQEVPARIYTLPVREF